MARTPWSLLIAVLLVLLGGCGGDGEWFDADGSAPTSPVSGHLDELEQLEVFAGDPPFASSTGDGRRDRCHEPDFERREPATWRDFAFEGPPGTVLRSTRVTVIVNDSAYDLTAEDSTSQVCPA